tara:strand:- start:196 stop:411 length:216 start_codon:yes stop_codon:yes gene_type:complete
MVRMPLLMVEGTTPVMDKTVYLPPLAVFTFHRVVVVEQLILLLTTQPRHIQMAEVMVDLAVVRRTQHLVEF